LVTAVRVVKESPYLYSELFDRRVTGELSMATPLGEKIRELRKAKGYTLDKLAELSDSSKSYIWELENKNPPRPSADKIAKIAAALQVTGDYLIDPTESLKVEDATDTAFFRKYRKMDTITKDKIRRMVDLMGEGE
jgi:transcriptional regulator with XRE-family HTH domain